MKTSSTGTFARWALRLSAFRRALPGSCLIAAGLWAATAATSSHATTLLADQPVFSNITVPGNLALALSVEFPTAVSVAHTASTYSGVTSTYLGYFDTEKCYLYQSGPAMADRYFYPAGVATNRACTGGKWSGNFLNWATMQTVDPFRWVLTGGLRVVDTPSLTVLEKAHASGQGGTGNFPNRSIASSALVASVTPVSWAGFNMRVQGLGNKMRFTGTGNVDAAPLVYDGVGPLDPALTYEVTVRVKVCDSNVGTAGPMESNCTPYPSNYYKPTGLMQRYAEKIRYSAFGYLNDSSVTRDGGVLRAKQKFIGPNMTVPGQPPQANSDAPEWNALDGTLYVNPDSATASAFGVAVPNSGVMNYLNKFGQSGSYKTYDPVSELYYATLRYYKNQGNVAAWSNDNGASASTKATWADAFPVITNWGNPVQYSCQKNFVLGIGDVNTHADKNVPGPTGAANEPTKPPEVVADTTVDAVRRTNQVGVMQSLGASLGTTYPYNGCCTNNSTLMAGLAYDANTKDILGRPDTATFKKQTVKTYWLDILEYQVFKPRNQFYLAAKYGGFKVPANFDPETRVTDIDAAWWRTTSETTPNGDPRPDNYFTAARPDQLVAGLRRVFSSISDGLGAYTTSFGTSLPQVALAGSSSYSAKYDPESWTGELEASSVIFDATTGAPDLTSVWTFSTKLATQAAGTGWNLNRRMATWNPSTGSGVAFRYASISSAQQTALDTVYRSGNDGADYLNYLRGDTAQEEGSTVPGSSLMYRRRTSLLGDIVNSRVRPVGPPTAPYSDGFNPGYGAFKTLYTSRPTMVFVGSNSGVLHAVDGSLTGINAGREIFAYVPGALFQGPTGTPDVNGLQARGDPNFTHKPMVDGTPAVFDIDFGRTGGTTATVDWRTLLVGSLGKGGKSYYAIDITNPAAMISETVLATKVLWEFTDPDLGYTYGEPTAVKTKKWGWVLIFGSGYNNSGQGFFFIVNPKTGALLEKVATGVGSASSQAGLAHVNAWVPDRTNFTADAAYAGDLLGNLWRLDLTAPAGTPYPAPLNLATLTNANGIAVPVTSRPLVVISSKQPYRRFVTVGTGRLLDNADILNTQPQAFYAVVDGGNNAFNTAALPAGVSYPVQRSNLQQLTDLTQRVDIDFNTKMGWWIDLGTVAGGNGWRVITESSAFFGVVTFAAMVPNGSACTPSGASQVYSIDVGEGRSQLLDIDGTTILPRIDINGVVTEHRTYNVNGTPRLIVSDDRGNNLSLKIKIPQRGLRRLNWRELPLAN